MSGALVSEPHLEAVDNLAVSTAPRRLNGYHDGIAWLKAPNGMNAVVDSSCEAAHPSQPELCLFAEHLAPFVSTPLFALQAKYDAWQVPNILRSSNVAVINEFGENLTNRLTASVLNRPGNAVFLDACYHHCGGYDVYQIDSMTQAQAVDIWYKNGSGALPNAGRIEDLHDYPCKSCCS